MKKKILLKIPMIALVLFLIQDLQAQTCTIDNSTSYAAAPAFAEGAAYKNFTDALVKLNAATISAPVIFNVTAGQTFNETALLSLTKTGTATNTIKFQKFGAGANPIIVPTAGTAAADAIFKLGAVSYITIDGIDLQESVSNTVGNAAMEYGFIVSNNSSSTIGSTNNLIKNCKITLNRNNTNSTFGVYQINSQSAASACSNNTYDNITVSNAYYGIYLNGKSNAIFDDANVVKNCTVGVSANDIGNNSTNTNAVYGIFCKYQSNLSVYNCEIKNVTATAVGTAVELDALYLILSGTSNIFNNRIHDITNNSVAAAPAVCSGMYIYSIASTDVINVYNNFVSGIYNGDAITTAGGSSSIRIMGFYIATGSLGITNIYNNSVLLQNSTTNFLVGAVNLYGSSSTAPGSTINVKNNIFKNAYVPATGSVSYCVNITNALTTINTLDYNNYDIAASGSSYTGRLVSTNASTLASWKTLTSKEINGKQFGVSFTNSVVGSENLHLNVFGYNHNYDGTPIVTPAITTDIDGETRSATVPYIGADELTAYNLPISFLSIKVYQQNAGAILEWNSVSTNGGNYVIEKSFDGISFTQVGLLPASSIQQSYSWVDSDVKDATNYYRVKSVEPNGSIKYSSIVKLKIGTIKQSLSISPNPVQNKTINLQLNGLEKSEYSVALIDANGRLVYTRSLGLIDGNCSTSLQLNESMQTGIYNLILRGASKQFKQTILIQ